MNETYFKINGYIYLTFCNVFCTYVQNVLYILDINKKIADQKVKLITPTYRATIEGLTIIKPAI